KRKDLLTNFRDDENCMVFLSTDAGGVGLNLQSASFLINMDIPWNPAVLEQRIARIHRLGQHKPVNIINFISKGTIEENLLGLLKFKKSVFAILLS
ncbi:MAG: SWF/SNF helicase family protein, partial [Nitrospirae bacterium]|nr:SWF/SNF helicase family protein [Nitrospirota bacterium]